MTSKTTHRFREAYGRLPEHVRRRAREAYRRFKSDPTHPSLRFKKVHATEPIYAARVGLGYRAHARRRRGRQAPTYLVDRRTALRESSPAAGRLTTDWSGRREWFAAEANACAAAAQPDR